ncbi:MAG: discoidin domain-containing protein [Saprospirales bacterium]|nr:discoidin domain-containing protein [Saprospirales bacterium]
MLDLRRKKQFNTIVLQEYLPEGQRVGAFRVDVWQNGDWREIARGTTIGHKKIVRFDPVKARKIRISVLETRAKALLSEVQVFKSE